MVEVKEGAVKRLTLIGIFALYCSEEMEKPGTIGAIIAGYAGKDLKFQYRLENGSNAFDGFETPQVELALGDGSSIQTVGSVQIEGHPARVDALTIDVSHWPNFDRLVFRDLGTSSSFIIFDIFAEAQAIIGCPFHERSGGVPLGELASIVRLGDRVRFSHALGQLEQSIDKATDLDEARGQALTFLSVVTAATLELGGSREMIRVGLNAARIFDRLETLDEIKQEAQSQVESVALPFLLRNEAPTDKLMDRALAMIERRYGMPISDEELAKELGLSTSHFRFLFKQTTGQPFHKYLVAVRLERAYQLLIEGDLRISQISNAVGFSSINHFSCAFFSRFKMRPTSVRKMKMVKSAS